MKTRLDSFRSLSAESRIFPASTMVVLLLVTVTNVHAATQVEEVTITAQRREETLSQSASAISVLSDADLYSGHIRTPGDLVSHLANFEVAQPVGNEFSAFLLRGIGLNDYNLTDNPAA